MKKKNYMCCGKKYKNINPEKFNKKCLICKKNNKNNKALICKCPYSKNNLHKGLIRQMNTLYQNESSNYMLGCLSSYNELYEYYDERWQDYYSSRF